MTRDPIAFCYNSEIKGARYAFMQQFSDAFNESGYSAVCLNLNDESNYHKLRKISGVFALYSDVRLKTLMSIHPPLPLVVWDLDHPSHRWAAWNKGMHDWAFAVHDRGNMNYMKQFFSGKTFYLPPGVCTEKTPLRPWKERDIDVLFIGSIYSTEGIPSSYPLFIRQIAEIAIEKALQYPMIPVHDLLDSVLSDMEYEEVPFFFHFICAWMDRIRSCHFRLKILNLLDKAHTPITLYGWKKSSIELTNLTLKQGVNFHDSFHLFSRAKIVLNISPMFNHGIHDRVLSTMGAGAVSLTNQSTYAKEQFTHEKDIIFYDWDKLEALPEMINDLLAQDQYLQSVAQAGRENALKNHRWINRIPLLKEALCLHEPSDCYLC